MLNSVKVPEWLVHQNYILTGIETRKEAEKFLKKDPYKMRVKSNKIEKRR